MFVSLVYSLGATPNHVTLKYRCMNKVNNQIRHVDLTLHNEVMTSQTKFQTRRSYITIFKTTCVLCGQEINAGNPLSYMGIGN